MKRALLSLFLICTASTQLSLILDLAFRENPTNNNAVASPEAANTTTSPNGNPTSAPVTTTASSANSAQPTSAATTTNPTASSDSSPTVPATVPTPQADTSISATTVNNATPSSASTTVVTPSSTPASTSTTASTTTNSQPAPVNYIKTATGRVVLTPLTSSAPQYSVPVVTLDAGVLNQLLALRSISSDAGSDAVNQLIALQGTATSGSFGALLSSNIDLESFNIGYRLNPSTADYEFYNLTSNNTMSLAEVEAAVRELVDNGQPSVNKIVISNGAQTST